jgi:predicted transcriptional regulator
MKFVSQNRNFFLLHDISSLPLEFIERLGELQEFEYEEQVGFVIAYTQRVVHDAEEYIWLMADHPLGGEEYVGGKKLTISNVTWRVIIPAQSNIGWARLRSSIGDRKGRIEYALMENSSNIKAGLALNEKIAGLTFPDVTTGRLDFNSGFRSTDLLFHKWCYDLFVVHWNNAKKKVRI